ncbi:hypothetical protein J1N35_005245 [Gossypium stocksii]|uniref:Uncharacterized protein n=1 Tax=Gossypium stocksii TaxID=47602 RepID=A0A9D3WFF9_9ROSI|nr:hypothetical protein J1N35_005245 [Gossypium stocksii]
MVASTPRVPSSSTIPRSEQSTIMDMLQHIHWQQQAYWRYAKIQDDLIRDAFKKIFHNPFIFVPRFSNLIFEPWTPLSRKEQDDLSKDENDEAKARSYIEGSANK